MEPYLIKKIIFDYFDGNNTSIQRKLIEEWLDDSKNKELFFDYLDEWEAQHPQYIFDIDNGFKKVYENIDTPFDREIMPVVESKSINSYPYIKWAVAASVVFFAIWIGWGKLNKPSTISYEKLVSYTKRKTGETYEKVNNTNKPLLINLPDKSSIILQPKSKICYSPKEYNKVRREVILAGEAFFEVQKNSQKPFLVYTNELITKVLGTSFFVKTRTSTADIEVIVKTGRVSVFLRKDNDRTNKIAGNALTGLVLNANEKVRISQGDFKIESPTIVDKKTLQLPIQRLTFDFDDAPVVDVLNDLEKAYSIRMVYDPKKIANCKLTAHLSDEPLMEKIKLICTAIEATYQEVDNTITINTNGCK